LIEAAWDPSKNEKPATDAAWQAVKGAKETVIKNRLKVGNEDALFVGTPVMEGGQLLGYIVAGYSLKFLDQEIEKNKRTRDSEYQSAWLRTAAIGLGFVLLGTVIAIYQGFAISRPIRLLAKGADEIARGHLEKRVPV